MKNIIITGGNGFLGRYIKAKLIKENFNVHNIGRSENSSIDLTTQSPILENTLFEKVIHIAGKAHSFPKTQGEEEAFYQVNLKGTKNLLKALNSLSIPPKSFIFISSVAVYGLIQGELVSEDAPTNANTPYGISKLKAEELIIKWCIKRKVKYQILRLPLIVGTNPPGNLGDMKRGIEKGFYFRINNNMAKKSVVLADDIAGFTAQEHNISGIYHLCDGFHPSLNQIEGAMEKRLNKKIIISIPLLAVKGMARIGDLFGYIFKKEMPISSLRLKKLTSTLTFDDSKARKELGWRSKNALEFIEIKI